MTTLTDFDVTHGLFKATECEWLDDNDVCCGADPMEGKAYCTTHFRQAYYTTPKAVVDDVAEKELTRIKHITRI